MFRMHLPKGSANTGSWKGTCRTVRSALTLIERNRWDLCVNGNWYLAGERESYDVRSMCSKVVAVAGQTRRVRWL